MIALFTDFGTRDVYVAQLKGAILSINPHATLVDLSHDAEPFEVTQAAYLLEQATRYYPPGTIVVAVVDPGVGSARHPLLVCTQAQKFYVGPDNGIFTRVLEREGFQAAYVLDQAAYFRTPHVSATFHGRDIFAPVAAHLSLGVAPACFGSGLPAVVMLQGIPPRRDGRTIEGMVQHIDHFGNILTNIPATLFGSIGPGLNMTVSISDSARRMPFYRIYAEGAPQTLMCLINSSGEFEVACAQGRATEFIKASVGARIVVTW